MLMRPRCCAILAFLALGLACYRYSTEVVAASPSGSYALESVDQDGLPARLAYDGDSWQVIIGSLNLLPNGYYVVAESDSIWNGRAFVRDDWTDGGTWTVDGSMLILSDTATRANDGYGGAASTYIGSIAPHAVSLTIPRDGGSDAHVYRYER